ncbi:alpha/beta hydrolase [Candidatus Dojkabacteria bacterium]|nr:alpha/beta hydrolase [Candidatus Dojkabacteria bacterium]
MKINQTKVHGQTIEYYDQGIGDTLLMIHGLLNAKEGLEPSADILSKNFRIIVPDLPGYGGSDQFLEGESHEEFADFLSDFIEELSLSHIHILGTSFGGTIAIDFASRYPQKTNKLILRAPLYDSNQIPKMISNDISKSLIKNITKPVILQKHIARIVCKIYADVVEKKTSDLQDQNSSEVLQKTTNIWLNRMNDERVREMMRNILINLLYIDLRPQIKQITNETLILWKKGDHFVGESGEELHKILKNSKYLEMHGKYHAMINDNIDVLTRRITDFLNEQNK